MSTLVVYYLKLPVETIETKFGSIPNSIPLPSFPTINFAIIQQLLQPALAIAVLGSIESLLSAVVADGMIGSRHRSNTELIGQGIANIFSGLFGGIPATGAIARTATNIKNGGRTPIAGMVHAVVLLLIMLLFAPAAKLIPLSCLAGILVVVAWHMGEWRHFFSLMKGDRLDVVVLLTTFFITIFFDLILAIEIGMILSSFIFMKRMSEATSVHNPFKKDDDIETLFEDEIPKLPKDILLYEINGPLFFGAAQKFQEVLTDLNQQPKVLIIRMRNVPFVDATGLHRLETTCHQLKQKGTSIIISGINEDIKKSFQKSEIGKLLGEDNIKSTISEAIEQAKKVIEKTYKIKTE